jgi:hypothetical protein
MGPKLKILGPQGFPYGPAVGLFYHPLWVSAKQAVFRLGHLTKASFRVHFAHSIEGKEVKRMNKLLSLVIALGLVAGFLAVEAKASTTFPTLNKTECRQQLNRCNRGCNLPGGAGKVGRTEVTKEECGTHCAESYRNCLKAVKTTVAR